LLITTPLFYVMEKSDVVIVGGVAAGPKTAAALARRKPNLKITLFEMGDKISYGTCGLPYFASGDINSFQELTITSYGVPRNEEFFKKSKGFEVITKAEVIKVDRERKTVTIKNLKDSETYEHGYGKLVLATGSNVTRAPFPMADNSKISHFTRPDDAINFRKAAQTGQIGKAVIVGSGFIGCEMAEATGSMWGIETVLIEKEEQLLPYALDQEMSAIVEREMVRNDVEVKTGCTVEKIEIDSDENPVVYLKSCEPIKADYVFLCLGVNPNISLAEQCGLKIGETGAIEVNEHMQTSDPNIYAGGDCVESRYIFTDKKLYLPLGSLANRHGWVIAENIAGNDRTFPGVTGAFLVKVYDMNVGSAGMPRHAAEKAGFNVKEVWGSFVDRPDYYPESKSITVKITYNADSEELIGLQAVGNGDVTRRVDVFSSFLLQKAKVGDLFDFEQGYAPPYSEAIDPLHHLAALAMADKRGIDTEGPGNLADTSDTIWLDVREQEEVEEAPWTLFGEAKSENRYINIPLNDLRENLENIDRDKRIMIICRRGPRSYQGAAILKNAGFSNVHVIGGGTTAVLS